MENIINQMAKIVEKKVKCNCSDFYKWDIEKLNERTDDNYIFIVRECGTFLLSLKALKENENIQNIYNYCYEENENSKSRIKPHKFYMVNIKKGTVKPFKKVVKLSEIIA